MYLELVTNERAAAVRVLEQYAENGDPVLVTMTKRDDRYRFEIAVPGPEPTP